MATFTGTEEYNPEVNLWVCRTADALAAETKTSTFRRGLLKRKTVYRTIYDHYGRPVCQVKVDDAGNSQHEFDNHQDATARPEPIRLSWATPTPQRRRKLFSR